MKPIGRYVLIEMIPVEEGDIALPAMSKISSEGIVLEVGTKIKDAHGNDFEFHVQKGDKIGFNPFSLTQVTWDGPTDLRFMIKHEDILYRYERD